MQFQKFRVAGWICHLQGDFKSAVLTLKELNQGSDVSAGQMVPAGNQQELQRLTRIGSTPIHRTEIVKDDAYLMGFCSVGEIRYDDLVQTVVLQGLLCRYSLSSDGAPKFLSLIHISEPTRPY